MLQICPKCKNKKQVGPGSSPTLLCGNCRETEDLVHHHSWSDDLTENMHFSKWKRVLREKDN